MATIDEIPFGRVLEALKPTLASVELRAVAVEIAGRWELAAGMLVATRASVDDIRAAHRELLDRSELPSVDQFQVILEVVPIDDLDAILSELDNGAFLVGGQSLHLADEGVRSWAPVRNQRMRGGHSVSVQAESNLFPQYTVSLPTPPSPEDLFKQAGLEPSDLGLTAWWELNEFMGLAFFARNGPSHVRVGLALPVYATLGAPSLRNDSARVSLHVHSALIPHLLVRGWIREDSDAYPSPSHTIELPALEEPSAIHQLDLEMPLDRTRLDSRHHVEFQLFHRGLGQLNLGAPSWVFPAQYRAYPPDPLVEALQHFDGGKHLDEYLTRSRPAKNQSLSPFEAAVIFTLAAINLRHVPLMVYRPAEFLRDEHRDDTSADVIAFDHQFGLLLLDCTSNPPPLDKVQRLRNTVQRLGSRVSTPIRGFIVCAADVSMLRKDWGQYGIGFIDAAEIHRLWDIARSGNIELALNHLRGLVHDVPALGQL